MEIWTWYGVVRFSREYWKPAFEVVVSDPGRVMKGRRKREKDNDTAGDTIRSGLYRVGLVYPIPTRI